MAKMAGQTTVLFGTITASKLVSSIGANIDDQQSPGKKISPGSVIYVSK